MPFQEEWLFGRLRLTAEVFYAVKNPAAAGCWIKLIFDRDRVCHRTVVKLSFARA